MARFFLVVATVIDLGLATLLVAVSGFLFGGGPQSIHTGALFTVAYIAAVLTCLVLPVIGFKLNAKGRTGVGLLVAFLPAIAGFLFLVIPVL